jgi:hypothetical protein
VAAVDPCRSDSGCVISCDVDRWVRATRPRSQRRETVQPMVYPFHGFLGLRKFACAAATESPFGAGVRALVRYEVSIEVVATFGVVHALSGPSA